MSEVLCIYFFVILENFIYLVKIVYNSADKQITHKTFYNDLNDMTINVNAPREHSERARELLKDKKVSYLRCGRNGDTLQPLLPRPDKGEISIFASC